MSDTPDLERRCRRLLAWYPESHRREHEEEMLAVLLAGAREGQRRPGLAESADLIRGALVMRVRRMGSEPASRSWADALALFSVLAPLFLLLADILLAAIPYHLSPAIPVPPLLWRFLGRPTEVGGLSLLSHVGFDATAASSAIIAALALSGLRRVTLAALAASTAVWIATQYLIPYPLQALTIGVYLLEAAALVASPGPRGRSLLSWRHGAALLPAAAAVEVSELRYDSTHGLVRVLARMAPTSGYAVAAVALAAAAAGLAVLLKLGRRLVLLLAAMLYPYVLQVTYPQRSSNDNLIAHPTPAHLALLFLPPALLAGGTVLAAALRVLRSRLSGSGEPGLT